MMNKGNGIQATILASLCWLLIFALPQAVFAAPKEGKGKPNRTEQGQQAVDADVKSLEKRHQAERKALEERYKADKEALKQRHKQERNAYQERMRYEKSEGKATAEGEKMRKRAEEVERKRDSQGEDGDRRMIWEQEQERQEDRRN